MKYISLLVGFLMSLATQSQVDFSGGLIAGGVASQISGDGLGGWDKVGVTGGAWIHMDYNGNVGTWMGMQYVNKGSKKQADANNGDFNSFTYKLDYIEIPLLMTYTRKNWRLGIGPAVGVLINQKIDFNGAVYEPSPAFNSLDFSGYLSIGWMISENSILEFRGGSSFIPTRPAPLVVNKLSYYEQGNYNQVIGLSYMWRFN